MKIPVALTIAGSDSGGGAGIQADLKTFAALGVHGTSAVTAITAQNTITVSEVLELPPALVRAQLDSVVEDLAPKAAKTGMLSSAEIIGAVADAVSELGIQPLVVDPVMVAKGGARLLREDAVNALRERLLPLAQIVTPNLPEAEVLLDLEPGALDSPASRRRAVAALAELGPQAIVLKGGHAAGEETSTDLFFKAGALTELSAARVKTTDTHGSGCVFSAAIAAELAKGAGLEAAVAAAKRFIQAAIESALRIGHGHGPVNPMHRQG